MTGKVRPPAPAPPYVGPPANHGGRDNKPIDRIVIHSGVVKCERGGARKLARYFKQTTRDASAHYCVDPGEVIQGLYDSWVGYAAPPNPHSLHVEMCDNPGPIPAGGLFGKLAWRLRSSWRWRNPEQRLMLRRTARLTAQLCASYALPPTFRGVSGLRAGRRGVTTHANVSKAFRQSTHWDPGFWPQRRFMRWVRQDHALIMSGRQLPQLPE